MSTKRLFGYDTDENGHLVINPEQAKIVERIYDEYLYGKTVDYIKRVLEKEDVKNWNGKAKWQATTIKSMLCNEKYKGELYSKKAIQLIFLQRKEPRMKVRFSNIILRKIMKQSLTLNLGGSTDGA